MSNVTNLEDFVLKKCLQSIEDIQKVVKEAQENLTPEEFEQFCSEAESELLKLNQIVLELKELANE